MKFKSTGSLIVAAIAVALVVLLAVWRDAPAEAAYPAEAAASAGRRTLRERWRAIRRANSVLKENARLKREVEMLSLVRGDSERLEAENARLRRLIDYVAKEPSKWMAAEVISEGCGAFGFKKALRLKKGTLDGVEVGAVVASADGLVGRISEVTPHTSVVALLTDGSVQVGCEVEGSRMRAVTAGAKENGMIALEHVRAAENVSVRARVVTSGLGGMYPKGIEIGVLVDGEVLPSVDFENLEDVYVRVRSEE